MATNLSPSLSGATFTVGARLLVRDQSVQSSWKGITVFGWTKTLAAWTVASVGALMYPSEVHYNIRALTMGIVGTRVMTEKVADVVPWQRIRDLLPADIEVRQTATGFEVHI